MSSTMSMFALPGHKVRLAASSAHSGYDDEKATAKKYLLVGGIYTVKCTLVSSSHSWVELEEVPGVHFNTIYFESLTEQTEEEDRQSPEYIRWYGPREAEN